MYMNRNSPAAVISMRREECSMAPQPRMAGPRGGHGMRGPRPKIENPGKIFKRVMALLFRQYGIQYVIVFVCILLNVYASLQGTMFTKTLIDSFILPLIGHENPDFQPLLQAILRVAIFYGIGILASFTQQRVMIYVTQGFMRNMRDMVFSKMESLPIKYFDTHAHGDIMSIYTNDIETLRQLVSQSIPQMFNSIFTVIGVLVCMVTLDIPLTFLSLLMVGLMMLISSVV